MIRSTLKHKKIEISEKVENLYLKYMYIAKLLNLHVLVSVIWLDQTSVLSMIFFSGVILYTIVRYFLNLNFCLIFRRFLTPTNIQYLYSLYLIATTINIIFNEIFCDSNYCGYQPYPFQFLSFIFDIHIVPSFPITKYNLLQHLHK